AEGYAHPEWLADAAWLRERLGGPGLRVVALTSAEEYAAGHVPGAVPIDWPELELTDTSEPAVAAWRGEVEAKLTPLGMRPDDTVVVYDGGTLYAPRLWWVLRHLGHRDVRVLDGGLPAWVAAGGQVETAGTWVGYSPDDPYRGAPDDALLATKEEVVASLGDPGAVLVDARSPEEYAAGHIPGAVNVPFTANARPDDPKSWKPAAELRALYEAAGLAPGTRVIPYCSTGVRSAVTAFTLALLGYDIALYTGSWAEWSADPGLPKTTGAAP
ncbi:MAG: sulfurtransferase, partial [Chloroflexota bacterium]|nr:sulfurtransferase [Chloroflexota bacterium]